MGKILNEKNPILTEIVIDQNIEPIFRMNQDIFVNCTECGTLQQISPEELIIIHQMIIGGYQYDYDNDYYHHAFLPTYQCLNPKCRKSNTNFFFSYSKDNEVIIPDYKAQYQKDKIYRLINNIQVAQLPDYARFENQLQLQLSEYQGARSFVASLFRSGSSNEQLIEKKLLLSTQLDSLHSDFADKNFKWRKFLEIQLLSKSIDEMQRLINYSSNDILKRQYVVQRDALREKLNESERAYGKRGLRNKRTHEKIR